MTRNELGMLLDQMTENRFVHAGSREQLLDYAEAIQKMATLTVVDQVATCMEKLQNHLLTTKQAG